MSNKTESNVRSPKPLPLATLGSLRNQTISTPLYENLRTDEAVGKVLDAVCWPKEKRQIQRGRVRLSYWYADNADAFTLLAEVCAAEGPKATFYEGARGNAVFKTGRKARKRIDQ